MKKIIIIIFIYLKILIIINAKFNFNRKLISDEKKEKLCTEKTKYYEYNTYLSIKEYVSSLNIYEGNKRTFLLSLILDNKTNHLNDFLIEVLGYMFVICLSFLFLISKIIFI